MTVSVSFNFRGSERHGDDEQRKSWTGNRNRNNRLTLRQYLMICVTDEVLIKLKEKPVTNYTCSSEVKLS